LKDRFLAGGIILLGFFKVVKLRKTAGKLVFLGGFGILLGKRLGSGWPE